MTARRILAIPVALGLLAGCSAKLTRNETIEAINNHAAGNLVDVYTYGYRGGAIHARDLRIGPDSATYIDDDTDSLASIASCQIRSVHMNNRTLGVLKGVGAGMIVSGAALSRLPSDPGAEPSGGLRAGVTIAGLVVGGVAGYFIGHEVSYDLPADAKALGR